MVVSALPEGVLQPDGSLSGFLYFEPLGRDVRAVTFTAQLVNASTGRQFGVISIPFVTVGQEREQEGGISRARRSIP